MRLLSQLLLTFLLNACWQIALVAATMALAARLLRKSSMRFQHLLWVSALVLGFALPIFTSATVFRHLSQTSRQTALPDLAIGNPIALTPLEESTAASLPRETDSAVQINPTLATVILLLYVLLLTYRGVRLALAASKTGAIIKGAYAVELSPQLQTIIDTCQTAFEVKAFNLRCSSSVTVPLTVGVRQPLIILSEDLIHQSDEELLTSAVGHEAVHVGRRDCLWNLIYEFLYLPLSFHPAAALIRRRIKQTRELCCDELVADRLLQPDVYARSLVRLAGSAAPFSRLAPTVTVGIADADILEVRIMSLLNRSEAGGRGKKLLIVAAALVLALPCLATAAFGFRFEVTQDPALSVAQENAAKAREQEEKERAASEPYKKGFQLGQEEKERRERAERDPAFREKLEHQQREEREIKEKTEREVVELKKALERETNTEIRAKLEAELKQKLAAGGYTISQRSPGAGLAAAKWAKISMKDAIQIANGQHPGTVLQCRLVGEREDRVFYDVLIVSGSEENPITTHVLVNAVNGTIFKTGRGEEPIRGASLNGKALRLPPPAYPEIAKAAQASGPVGVEVIIDEAGNVIAARAISGHPLLQAAAVSAARNAQFSPTQLNGEPVKVTGVITYNFVAN